MDFLLHKVVNKTDLDTLWDAIVPLADKINVRDNKGRTPLFLALEKLACKPRSFKRYEIVKILLDHNADVNIKTENGTKPIDLIYMMGSKYVEGFLANRKDNLDPDIISLCYACRGGNEEMVKYLLDEERIDPNEYDNDLLQPIHYALLDNDDPSKIINVLLAHGADLNSNPIKSPLHYAIFLHHERNVVLQLIQNGADVNSVDCNSNTPLHVACFFDSVDVAQILIDNGASTNSKNCFGLTPFEIALVKHSRSCIDHFGINNLSTPRIELDTLDISPEKDGFFLRKDNSFFTPGRYCLRYNSSETLKSLLSLKDEVDVDGYSLLKEFVNEGLLDFVKILIKSGRVNINQTPSVGELTPLMVACRNGNYEMVQLLLEQGADPLLVSEFSESEERFSAIYYAMEYGSEELGELILKSVDKIPHVGMSPIFPLIKKRSHRLLGLLLQKYRYVEITDYNDETPLLMACRMGDINSVRLLLEAGADPNNVCMGRKTPLLAAFKANSPSIISHLTAYGAQIYG